MSRPFKDPSLLTKDRLKKDLEKNGIKLPRSDQKKEFYVRLYEENLSPRRLANGEFSSDDDEYERSEPRKEIIPRTSRSIKKVGSKEIISKEIKSMTNEELREGLSDLGQPVGPILPSTRGLYEQKLARLQATSPKSTNAVATITNSEFSDDDFRGEQEPEEENIPDDEFSYGSSSQRSDDFGSNFSKNFEGSSSKKEVTRDFSMSSSRNVERSSSFDSKTINKVRTKKGDTFEEKSWSSTDDNEKEKDGGINMNSLPTSIQKALTSAGRLTPEKENGTGMRERSSWKSKPEQPPKKHSRRVTEEKPMMTEVKKVKKSETSSRKWWILLLVLILLVILAAAVAYNIERLPIIQQQFPSLSSKQDTAPKQNTT